MWLFSNRTATTNPIPPSRKEFVGSRRGPIGLDEEYMLEHFLGVTAEEFRKRLTSGNHWSGWSTEDLMYMAHDGLRYYLPVLFDYLQSSESKDDWEVSHGLLCSLSFQITFDWFPDDLRVLAVEIADYVDANREKFDIEPDDELIAEYFKTIRKHGQRTTA